MTKELSGESFVGWLAAVIPADVRRVRIHDGKLAEAFEAAGAEAVEHEPDVEIVRSHRDLRGDASLGIIAIDPSVPGSPSLATRAGRRLLASVSTRIRAVRARRELRRRGYREASVLLWDLRQRLRVEGMPVHSQTLVERLPSRALAIGRRAPAGPTALDAAVADASRQVGSPLALKWISVRSGVLLAEVDGGILRAAIGGGRVQIQSQAAALELLESEQLPAAVTDRVPWLLAQGRSGLADWSLERRLPGRSPPRALPESLVAECHEFLVALHRTPANSAEPTSAAELAETAASVCRPEEARLLGLISARLDDELTGVRRGFGHGDFFAGNLLADRSGLTAVLDWDAAGPGRLPLVDLLHLELTQGGYGTDNDWGPAVVERLLPEARAGGSDRMRQYCGDVELDPDPQVLESLVLSYWLGYVAYQLRTHPARRAEPVWIDRNIVGVVRNVEPRPRAR